MPPRKSNCMTWTQEETDLLLKGIEEHGKGNWMRIVDDPKYALFTQRGKSNVHLKDKYRAMMIASEKGVPMTTSTEEAKADYEAEKIVDIARTEQGTVFLIKWKGYDSSENTWQSEAKVKKHAPALIKAFRQ